MTLGRHSNTECHLPHRSQKVHVCKTFLRLLAKPKEQTVQKSLLGGLGINHSVCSRAWKTVPSRSWLGRGERGSPDALTLTSPVLKCEVDGSK